jgi:hypothetical protein
MKAGIGLAMCVGQPRGHKGNIQSKDDYREHKDIDAGTSTL